MGGTSQERRVSMQTGKAVVAHLDRLKYAVRSVELDRKGLWRKKITASNTDLVFIALHGELGEDGHVQGYLEVAGIPYTGSGVLASAIGMDKAYSKMVFENAGVPVLSGISISKNDTFEARYAPAVVKPSNGGSSIDVHIADSLSEVEQKVAELLKKYERVLVEPYVTGRELSVPVLGNDRARPLPVIEITPSNSRFFDYTAKYKKGAAEEQVPAKLPDVLAQKAQYIAVQTHKSLGCRGCSRVDMILTPANHFKVLEINTLPGLTPNSLIPKSAAAAGIPFPELLDEIIRCTL